MPENIDKTINTLEKVNTENITEINENENLTNSILETNIDLSIILNYFENTYLQGLIVIILTISLGNIITWALMLSVDKFIAKTKLNVSNKLLHLMDKPVFYIIMSIGFSTAIKVAHIPHSLEIILFSILKTSIIFVWTKFIIKIIKIILNKLAKYKKISFIKSETLPLFQNAIVTIIIILSIYLIFSAWGINMTAWLASAGVIGIAVGFAAKDTLANLISGMFILTDAPYKIGDTIILATGEKGEVVYIGIRSTRIVTRDDIEITIPNSIMGNTQIVNESGGPVTKLRLRIPVGVAYGSDLNQVEELLINILKENNAVSNYPNPMIRVRNFGASSIDLTLHGWIDNPQERAKVTHFILKEIYLQFNKNNIEIPYSKQELYIKEFPNYQK